MRDFNQSDTEWVAEAEREAMSATPVTDHGKGDKAARPRIKLTSASELKMKPLAWTIHRYFESEAIVFIYGESQAFKTFLCLDIACCVALGRKWGPDCAVNQGVVAYVCGEGAGGIRRRLEAWSLHNGQSVPENLYISSCSTDLSNPLAVQDLRDELDALPAKPVLIGVDTMARNFAGAENEATDIGKFYSMVEHNFVKQYGCSVLVTHHPGKDVSRGPRGSASIKQNSDAMFRVERHDSGDEWFTTLTAEKMKDAPLPKPVTFEAKRYMLNIHDEFGEQGSSLAMDYMDDLACQMIAVADLKDKADESAEKRKELLKLILKDNTMKQVDYAARADVSKACLSRYVARLRKDNYLKGNMGNLKVTAKGKLWAGIAW